MQLLREGSRTRLEDNVNRRQNHVGGGQVLLNLVRSVLGVQEFPRPIRRIKRRLFVIVSNLCPLEFGWIVMEEKTIIDTRYYVYSSYIAPFMNKIINI